MTDSQTHSTGTGAAEAQGLLEAGLALSQGGRGAEAIARYRESIGHAPNWHLPHFLLGSEYAAAADYVQAEASFARTLLLAPEFHLARYQLGLLQFSGGRPHVALLTWAGLSRLPADQPYPLLVAGFTDLLVDQMALAMEKFAAALPLAGNSGLEADIRKLVAGLEEQLRGSGTVPANYVTAAADPVDDQPAATNHVLLSNYAGKTVH